MAQSEGEARDTMGLRLLILRTRRRWSLRELEERTGIPSSLLSQYENDKRNPTLARLLRRRMARSRSPGPWSVFRF